MTMKTIASRPDRSRGFTLIELLVVIAIIGLLSSIVLAALTAARNKGYDAQRVSNLKSMQNSLELYYDDNHAYPAGAGGYGAGTWSSQCAIGTQVASPNSMIPGLVPKYSTQMPVDPQMDTTNNYCCYAYSSTQTDYKFVSYNCPYSSYKSIPGLLDTAPGRNCQGAHACDWTVYTPGATNW